MSSSVQNTDLEMGSPNQKITIPYVETVNKAPCRYECRYDGHCFIHTHACMDLILIHPRPTSSLVGSPRRDSCPPDTDERLMNESANSCPTQRKPHLPSRLNRPSPPQAVRPRRNTVSLLHHKPRSTFHHKTMETRFNMHGSSKPHIILCRYFAFIKTAVHSFRCKTG